MTDEEIPRYNIKDIRKTIGAWPVYFGNVDFYLVSDVERTHTPNERIRKAIEELEQIEKDERESTNVDKQFLLWLSGKKRALNSLLKEV